MFWVYFFKIVVGLVTTGLMGYRKFVRAKNVTDAVHEKFDYETWIYENREDLVYCSIAALLVGGLSSELAIPVINKFLNWPDLAQGTITYTGVSICAVFGWLTAEHFIKP